MKKIQLFNKTKLINFKDGTMRGMKLISICIVFIITIITNISAQPKMELSDRPIFDGVGGETFKELSIGEGTSGGSTGILLDKGSDPILFDLFVYDNNFRDVNLYPEKTSYKKNKSTPYGLNKLSVKDLAIYKFLIEKIDLWKDSSPILIKKIKETINSMTFIPTQYYLEVNTNEDLGVSKEQLGEIANKFPNTKLFRVAHYAPSHGAVLSWPLTNQYGDYSRTGIIIHESLRQIQFSDDAAIKEISKDIDDLKKDLEVSYNRVNDFIYHNLQKTKKFMIDHRLSTEKIIKITARILLADPNQVESFDTKEYLNYNLIAELNFIIMRNQFSSDLCSDLSFYNNYTDHLQTITKFCNKFKEETNYSRNLLRNLLSLKNRLIDLLVSLKVNNSNKIISLNKKLDMLNEIIIIGRKLSLNGLVESNKLFFKGINPFTIKILTMPNDKRIEQYMKKLGYSNMKYKNGVEIDQFTK